MMLANIRAAVSITLLSLYVRVCVRGLYPGAGRARLYVQAGERAPQAGKQDMVEVFTVNQFSGDGAA